MKLLLEIIGWFILLLFLFGSYIMRLLSYLLNNYWCIDENNDGSDEL